MSDTKTAREAFERVITLAKEAERKPEARLALSMAVQGAAKRGLVLLEAQGKTLLEQRDRAEKDAVALARILDEILFSHVLKKTRDGNSCRLQIYDSLFNNPAYVTRDKRGKHASCWVYPRNVSLKRLV